MEHKDSTQAARGQVDAREKFWLFGVRPGQDDLYIGRCEQPRVGCGSKVTPAEAALYLNCDGIPPPFSQQAESYAFTFTPMKKVLWSSTGSGGFRMGNEEDFIVQLAEKYPNICGAFMDDFFGKFRKFNASERVEKTRDLLKMIRAGLDKSVRRLDLYVVWYTHETGFVDPSIFQYIDGITLWTWDSKGLPKLEERFADVEAKFPGKKILLGVYLFDFVHCYPVPRDLMEHQCELGLKLMREGRVDGMIFEANSVMGVGFENDQWTRQWIQRVGWTLVPE